MLAVVGWSANATAVKYALTHGFAPVQLAALRWPAAALLFSLMAHVRRRGSALGVDRRDLRRAVLLGIVAVWVNQLAFSFGVDLSTASSTSLVFGTLPVFVAVYSALGRRELPTLRYAGAVVLSLSGVAFITVGGEAGGTLPHVGIGSALVLFAAATWALYSVAAVPMMARSSPLRVNAVVTSMGGLLLGLTGLPSLIRTDWGAVTPVAWLSFAFCVVVSTVGANLLWFEAIDRLGPSDAVLFVNLQPFVGALIAVALLSDRLGWFDLLGGAAIGAALIVGRRSSTMVRQRRESRAATERWAARAER